MRTGSSTLESAVSVMNIVSACATLVFLYVNYTHHQDFSDEWLLEKAET